VIPGVCDKGFRVSEALREAAGVKRVRHVISRDPACDERRVQRMHVVKSRPAASRRIRDSITKTIARASDPPRGL
jgi:hypothetical protein